MKKDPVSPNNKIIKDEDKVKTPSKASVKKVHFIGEASESARPSKRMKIDHEEQVTQLFQSKVKNEVFD